MAKNYSWGKRADTQPSKAVINVKQGPFSYDQEQVNGAGKAPGRLRRSEGFEGPSSSFTKRLQGCCEQYRSDGSTLQARGKKAKMESF